MRLSNSVDALKKVLGRKKFSRESFDGLVEFSRENYPKVKDHELSALSLMWHRVVPAEDRDYIIAHSIPRDEWVGGYADYNDAHLFAMLRKTVKQLG